MRPGNDRFFATEGYDALGLLRPPQVDTNADAAQHGVSQFLADSGVETSNDIDREIEAAVTGIEAKISTAGWFQRDESVLLGLMWSAISLLCGLCDYVESKPWLPSETLFDKGNAVSAVCRKASKQHVKTFTARI